MSETKKNKKILLTALILMIGVSLIPLIYSTTYIASVWDVYGNTDKMPIAVVNLDRGAEYDGEKVNFGKDVTDSLKENTSMKWEFVDEETARNGLQTDNKYYAVITIPADFSEDITSAATETKTQATIEYSANEKRNYTASLMLRSAMLTLKDKVKSKEASKITETLVAELNSVPENLETITEGTGQLIEGNNQLSAGFTQLSDGNTQITQNLNTLSAGISEAKAGTTALAEGTGKLPELITGTQTLSNGAATLAQGAPKLEAGISSVSEGLNTLQRSVSDGIEGGKLSVSSKLGDSISSGVNGAIDKTLTELTPAISAGIQKSTDTLAPAIDQGVRSATDTALGESSQASQALGTFTEGVTSYIEGSKNYVSFPASVTEYTAGVEGYTGGVDQLIALVEAGDFDRAKAAAAALRESGARLSSSTEALKQGASLLSANSETLLSGADALTENASAVKSIPDQVKQGLDTKLASALKTGISDGLNRQLAPQLISGIESGLKNDLAPQLSAGLTEGISSELGKSLDELNSGVSEGVDKLQTGILGVSGSGLQADGSPALLAGAENVSSGAGELATGAEKLAAGAGELNRLSEGIGTLDAGMTQLSDGASQLAAGSSRLGDGIWAAAGGNSKLGEGLESLNSGVSNAIANANDKLTVTDGLSEHVADAVEIEQEPYDHVPNYGTSFAPYFFNVSLWTGGLVALMTIFYDYKRRLSWLGPKSPKPVLRFLTFLGIAAAQGILCGLAAQFILGLPVNNPLLYYIGLPVIGMTFTLIIEFFMLNFGDIGKMLSMILMVLQLTATGGTFPVELNPPFFQAIHKLLPMSYGIQMMKEAVSGSSSAYWAKNFGIMLGFAAAAVAGILVGKLIRHIWNEKHTKHTKDTKDKIHPGAPRRKTVGSDGWDNRQRRNGRYLWQRLSICRKYGRRLPGLPGEGSRRCGSS